MMVIPRNLDKHIVGPLNVSKDMLGSQWWGIQEATKSFKSCGKQPCFPLLATTGSCATPTMLQLAGLLFLQWAFPTEQLLLEQIRQQDPYLII